MTKIIPMFSDITVFTDTWRTRPWPSGESIIAQCSARRYFARAIVSNAGVGCVTDAAVYLIELVPRNVGFIVHFLGCGFRKK